MPVRPARPCIGVRGRQCKALVRGGPRCPACQQDFERARNASPHRKALYGGNWAAKSHQAILDYRAKHGDTCPGWGVVAHPISPAAWTCDHELGPLCRSCNSRKAGATETRR